MCSTCFEAQISPKTRLRQENGRVPRLPGVSAEDWLELRQQSPACIHSLAPHSAHPLLPQLRKSLLPGRTSMAAPQTLPAVAGDSHSCHLGNPSQVTGRPASLRSSHQRVRSGGRGRGSPGQSHRCLLVRGSDTNGWTSEHKGTLTKRTVALKDKQSLETNLFCCGSSMSRQMNKNGFPVN